MREHLFTETKTTDRSYFHPQAIYPAIMAALLAFTLVVPVTAAAQETPQGAGNANQDQQQDTGAAEGTGAGTEDSRIEVRPGCIRIQNPGQLLQVGPSCEDEEEGGEGPAGLAEDEELAPQTSDETAGTLTDTLETQAGTPVTTAGDDDDGESKENASAPTPEEAPEGSAKDLLDQIIADCGVEDSAAATEDAEPVPVKKATNTDEKAATTKNAELAPDEKATSTENAELVPVEKAATTDAGGEGAVVEGSAQDQEEAIEDEDGLSDEECQKLKRALLPEGSETSDDDTACPTSPTNGIRATVAEAIDGDTVRLEELLDGNDTVRLIGVDAPELEGEDGAPEPHAEAAAAFAAGALEGRDVILELGERETDAYGRLLAYVLTTQGAGDATEGDPERTDADSATEDEPELFNTTLLEKGLAEVFTIAPNDLYMECFEAAEQSSRDEGKGIWETENGSPDEGDQKQPASEQPVPEQNASDQSASEQNASEQSVSEQSVSEQSSLKTENVTGEEAGVTEQTVIEAR